MKSFLLQRNYGIDFRFSENYRNTKCALIRDELNFNSFQVTLFILQYIRDHYGEDPALYNKAVNELEQLRQVPELFYR